jgi:thiosulfate/3-mercaptopyruvate sulfurtransferase
VVVKTAILVLLFWIGISGSGCAQDELQHIAASELKQWISDGRDLEIIDVRGKLVYQTGAIAGSVNAGNDPRGYLPAVHSAPIILIAPHGMSEKDLEVWVQRLQKSRQQLWILSGGIDAWVDLGEPLVEPDSEYTRPGTVPFLVPKGLCDQGESAQRFE